MDSDDPVYVKPDKRLITEAALGLREDESGIVETLNNLVEYRGR